MPKQTVCTRLTALGCVALATGLLLPSPAAAEPVARPTGLLASARAITVRHAEAARETQQGADAPRTDLRSGSFFKSKAGVLTLAVFGAGVGYCLYSTSKDRIKSPGR